MNVTVFLVSVLLFNFQTQEAPIISKLIAKTWKGKGQLMGAEATFQMRWNYVLDGNFLRMQFKNERKSADGNLVQFEATGMYKITEGEVSGTWFDSRGISFPLKGELLDRKLTIMWGSPEIEQGKTIYALNDEHIEVSDFVLRNGEYLPFGSAVYQ